MAFPMKIKNEIATAGITTNDVQKKIFYRERLSCYTSIQKFTNRYHEKLFM